MTMQTRAKKRSLAPFEVRSVLLFSALAIGAALAAHAQGSAPLSGSPSRPATQLAASASADAIPHNRATSQDLEAAFKRADSNADGRLSRLEAEHFPAMVQHFDRIDTDHDSFLSRAEFQKAAGS